MVDHFFVEFGDGAQLHRFMRHCAEKQTHIKAA